MKLADFQVLCVRSDPRTALIFQRPFVDVFPHIAVMGHELPTKVMRYHSRDYALAAAGSSSGHAALAAADTLGGPMRDVTFNTATGEAWAEPSPFLKLFQKCLDEGAWLVVEGGLPDVAFHDWRHVGNVLAQLLPNAKHHLRKHFRLFSFIDDQSTSPNLWSFAPGIFCQFALVVDMHNKVHTRSDVSPIFHGECSVDTIGDVMSTLVNNAAA